MEDFSPYPPSRPRHLPRLLEDSRLTSSAVSLSSSPLPPHPSSSQGPSTRIFYRPSLLVTLVICTLIPSGHASSVLPEDIIIHQIGQSSAIRHSLKDTRHASTRWSSVHSLFQFQLHCPLVVFELGRHAFVLATPIFSFTPPVPRHIVVRSLKDTLHPWHAPGSHARLQSDAVMAPKRLRSASDAVPDVKRPQLPPFHDEVEHFEHSEAEYSGSEDEHYVSPDDRRRGIQQAAQAAADGHVPGLISTWLRTPRLTNPDHEVKDI